MWYLTLIKVGVDLADKASDGELSYKDICDVVLDLVPEADDIIEEVEHALEDGKLTVDEVLKIVVRFRF